MVYFAYELPLVIPVFWFTDIELGGLGFTPFLIAIFLGVSGLAQAIWLLWAFPPLQHRFGSVGVLRWCSYAWPLFFAFNPVCNVLLRNDLSALFWATAPVLQLLGSGVAMAFSKMPSSGPISSLLIMVLAAAIQLSVNDIAPSPATLGTVNALALALSSGIRAVAPAASTSLFAVGVRGQILGGQLAWAVLIVQALTLVIGLRYLPKKAEGKVNKSNGLSDSVGDGHVDAQDANS